MSSICTTVCIYLWKFCHLFACKFSYICNGWRASCRCIALVLCQSVWEQLIGIHKKHIMCGRPMRWNALGRLNRFPTYELSVYVCTHQPSCCVYKMYTHTQSYRGSCNPELDRIVLFLSFSLSDIIVGLSPSLRIYCVSLSRWFSCSVSSLSLSYLYSSKKVAAVYCDEFFARFMGHQIQHLS